MPKSTGIQRAVARFEDSPTKLAAAVGQGVLRQHVEHWLKAERVPEKHAQAVKDVTGVPLWDLCPETWHTTWPDLIGSDDAPIAPGEKQEAH